MPKNSKPDEFDDECLPGGPNGWCKRHGYPWAMCAAVARRAEEGADRLDALTREVERLRARLTWLSEWIVQHHPEDFRKGLWDAINAADKAALTPAPEEG